MQVDSISLTEFVKLTDGLSADVFVRRHPGVYLVAMGVLSVELRSETLSGLNTFEMFRDDHARHSTDRPPLAGKVFSAAPHDGETDIVIGRDADCDISVPDPSVSGRHCRLQLFGKSGLVLAHDLDSRNGTSINNEAPFSAQMPVELEDGDLLTVGRFSFQFFGPQTFHAALRILQN